MLGVVSQSPALAREWLEAFYALCTLGKVKSTSKPGHLDGWGMAGYPNGQAGYYGRSARAASDDCEAWQKALDEIEKRPTPIILAHFRKASVGNQTLENTHPFLRNGWLFCHNGTIFNADKLPLKKYTPKGETDSERFFLFLLETLERHKKPKGGIDEAIYYVQKNLECNSLTFLLTNGATLYAHRSYSDQRMEKEETLEERDRYYTLRAAGTPGIHLICSEPILTKKIPLWKPLINNELFNKTL